MPPEIIQPVLLGLIALLLKKLVDQSSEQQNKISAMEEKLSSAHKRIDANAELIEKLRARFHEHGTSLTRLELLAGQKQKGGGHEMDR